METVLAGLTQDKCLACLDDILVVQCMIQEHFINLRSVLQRLQAAGLKLKARKVPSCRHKWNTLYMMYPVIRPQSTIHLQLNSAVHTVNKAYCHMRAYDVWNLPKIPQSMC